MGKVLKRERTLSKLYYDPSKPSAFTTSKKLQEASNKTPAAIKAWLERREAYTLHRKVRK
jgi:hypothetical protein